MSTTAAVLLLITITAYAVFGGADFGAGFWDLVAGGADRGAEPREVIDHSIAPVWEANHVWLIFTFVVLWTCFPEAYSSITLTLFVPLAIAAFGIVLRGAGFAFRKVALRTREQRAFGASFAASSVIVPYCFGSIAGAIVSGRVPLGGDTHDPWGSWLNPTSVVCGVLAVCVSAYLAAVFLVWDSRRLSDEFMAGYFRRRAIAAAVVVGVASVVGIIVLHRDAHYAFDGLTSRALPLVVVSVLSGLTALVLLRRRGSDRGARLAAATAVAALVVGWGVAQWDYLLPTTLTVSAGAAPDGTIGAVLVAAAAVVLLIVPGFLLLYVLDQKGLLPEESVSDASGH
jgi:cytochrome d ubiquinol oxidase subunit II